MKSAFSLTCVLIVLLTSVCTAQDASPTPADKQIKVYIVGAVVQRGVYRLPANATLSNAITAAGGLEDDAESVWLYKSNAKGDYCPFAKLTVKDVRGRTKEVTLKDGDQIRVNRRPGKPEL